jgi:hypothetical protein
METTTKKGFIKDWTGRKILPITRGELVLDCLGNVALTSDRFLAGELKDAKGEVIANNLPGLITAAERAMLKGAPGNSLSDLYTKVGYINTGLSFNGTTLNFYNTSGAATPITITANNGVTMGVSGNDVTVGLTTLTTAGTEVSNILKSIKVDKYGRVTEVTGSALTNAEIPTELTGKTITTGTLNGCVTSNKEIGDDEKAIANKAYVDAKFTEVSGVATGALKFGGGLGSTATATASLTKTNWNTYYKATADFNLNVSDLYDDSGLVGKTTITVKTGDTLIVYPKDSVSKFVYVPSGDDITTITVRENGTNIITSAFDDVILNFAKIFAVSKDSNKSVTIDLPKATSSDDGYLSKEDYIRFSNYESGLAVTYTGEFSTGTGVYKIGTISVGNNDNVIYGKNNITALVLNNGASNEYNPVLKFTEDGVDTSFTFKGGNSIKIKKNSNDIEFAVVNEVDTNSAKYAEFDTSNNKLKIKIGSVDGNTVNGGLTDYEEFITLQNNVITRSLEVVDITNSLTDTTKTYYYGSTSLVEAINITI